jgi:hypothetical protein
MTQPKNFAQLLGLIAEHLSPEPTPPVRGLAWWPHLVTTTDLAGQVPPPVLVPPSPCGPGWYVRGWHIATATTGAAEGRARIEDIELVTLFVPTARDATGTDITEQAAHDLARMLNDAEASAQLAENDDTVDPAAYLTSPGP